MKREEIEKASNEKFGDNSFPYKGFIEGVEWRINSVWHTNKVKPTSFNLIIRIKSYHRGKRIWHGGQTKRAVFKL